MGVYKIKNLKVSEYTDKLFVTEYDKEGYILRRYWIKREDLTPDDCPLIEIIPCKECKNSHMTYGGECKYCDLILDDDDNYIECYFDGNHFCEFGERK